jgi:hypothetical protein
MPEDGRDDNTNAPVAGGDSNKGAGRLRSSVAGAPIIGHLDRAASADSVRSGSTQIDGSAGRSGATDRATQIFVALPGGAGEEGGHDVGGVPVKGHSRPVVAHRRTRIGVARRLLHVSERDAGVEGGGDERVAERVRPDRLVDPGLAGEASDDPPSRVAVQRLAVPSEEDRAFYPLGDGQVDRSRRARRERDSDDLAALAHDSERAMAALHAERLDVGAQSFGDPQAVDGEEGDQRVIASRGQTGRDEERPHLVAV